MDKSDKIVWAIIFILSFLLFVSIAGTCTDYKVCQAKGGVYMSSKCLKKELFVE